MLITARSALVRPLIAAALAWWLGAVQQAAGFGAENGARPSQVFWDPSVKAFAVLETGTREITWISTEGERRAPHKPSGESESTRLAFSADGQRMARVNRWYPQLIVAAQGGASATLPLADAPIQAAFTPDGKRVVVACDAPGPEPRLVCIVDLASPKTERIPIPNSSGLRGVAVDPKGLWAFAAHLVPKSNLPSTQFEQGWVFTNAISRIPLRGQGPVATLSLDTRTRGYANPEGVAVDPLGRFLYVAHAGADVVSVIDLDRFHPLADAVAAGGAGAPSDEFVVARIPVGTHPQGIAASPDGRHVAVANRLDDTVSILSVEQNAVVKTVSLTPALPAPSRRGERLFYSGKLSLNGQFSCASCHPDGHTDGLNWDLPKHDLPGWDGAPRVSADRFLNTKSLYGTAGTEPYGWLGTSADLEHRIAGTLRGLFAYEPPADELAALRAYLEPLDYPRDLPARVMPDAAGVRRGAMLFFELGCAKCHAGERFTDQRPHALEGNRGLELDTPSLRRVSETGPWWHDGSARSLGELFEPPAGNAAGTFLRPAHGGAGRLNPDQRRDLVEFLRSL
jgi:YVTN family beta-propeller protein